MDAWYKIKLYLKTNLDFFVKSTERIFMNIYKKKKKRILYVRERERERERENTFTSKIIPKLLTLLKLQQLFCKRNLQIFSDHPYLIK